MKTPIRLSRILILGCSLSALFYVLLALTQGPRTFTQPVQSEEPTAQETYISEVVIQAPWGERNLWYDKQESGPGEFGMHITGEGPPVTPSGFAVAPNGDIYINDPLNKRIQRYGPNGEFISAIPIMGGFICVDEDNDIYTTRASRPHWFIEKYDQTGNLLTSYPIEIERRGLYGIHCDKAGRLFMEFYYHYMKPDNEGRPISDSSWHGICQVGDAERVFSLEEQQDLIRKDAYLGSNSAGLDSSLLLVPSHGLVWGYGNLCLVNLTGDTVRVLKGIRGAPFGCDENLNIYTEQYDLENHITIVRKYRKNGEFVSMLKYTCDDPYAPPASGGIYLDTKGGVYFLCESVGDGIQVTKWYKAD